MPEDLDQLMGEECESRLSAVFVENKEKCFTNFVEVTLHGAFVLWQQNTLACQFLRLDQKKHRARVSFAAEVLWQV